MFRSNSNFSTSANLVANVNRRRRIVTDNHSCQARRYVVLTLQRGNFGCNFSLNRIGGDASVEQFSAMSFFCDHRRHRNIGGTQLEMTWSKHLSSSSVK